MTFSEFCRLLWSPVAALWGEVKGLRTEEVRSVAVVAGIVMMFLGFDRVRQGDSLLSPFVVFTLVGQAMAFGLAWQATHGKLKWGAAMIEVGRDPDPDNRVTYSATNPPVRFAVDDPDE